MTLDSAELTRCLGAEVDALRTFVALLRDEQRSLINGEIDALASYLDPKSRHMFELTRLEEQRRQLLQARGFSPDRAGMERLVREHAWRAPALVSAWRELLQLTQRAQQLNTTNGTLVATRLGHTQQSLNVLFTAARLPGAYAPDGSTVTFRPAHRLAVA
jgi:flagellar biosynthesis protein FlgN